MQIEKKRLRILISIVVGVVVLIVASVAYYAYNKEKNLESERGKSISLYYNMLTIENIKDFPFKGVEDDLAEGVFGVTIAKHGYDKDSRYTGTIRDGSYSSDIKSKYTQKEFIFDAPSEKKSWKIIVSMVNDRIGTNGVLAQCLPSEELKYGPFECKAARFDEVDSSTVSADPLISKLPHKAPYYTISGVAESKTETGLAIRIMLNANSDSTKKFFLGYQEDALSWIREQGVDPANYKIVWRNLAGNEVPYPITQ
ncbi:hypothetical protein KI440_01370 [Candidatus Saccharibacteria bacterium TM7i]|nr:hypothetical protein KI440_01370 [Candidatus Saccharibacteria bacterium TM7i]